MSQKLAYSQYIESIYVNKTEIGTHAEVQFRDCIDTTAFVPAAAK